MYVAGRAVNSEMEASESLTSGADRRAINAEIGQESMLHRSTG
jgi:hypothetical protein